MKLGDGFRSYIAPYILVFKKAKTLFTSTFFSVLLTKIFLGLATNVQHFLSVLCLVVDFPRHSEWSESKRWKFHLCRWIQFLILFYLINVNSILFQVNTIKRSLVSCASIFSPCWATWYPVGSEMWVLKTSFCNGASKINENLLYYSPARNICGFLFCCALSWYRTLCSPTFNPWNARGLYISRTIHFTHLWASLTASRPAISVLWSWCIRQSKFLYTFKTIFSPRKSIFSQEKFVYFSASHKFW